VSEVVDLPEQQTISRPKTLRWRLIPAAILMVFGILNIALVAVILSALLVKDHFNLKLFEGPNSPELSPHSLAGMGLVVCLGVAWCIAGRLIWRKKVLAGLLLAVVSYPLGAYGANWMFSSALESPKSVPDLNQPAFPPPRFDNRRKAPPALADVSTPVIEARSC
jgi:hypothetical protein